MSSQIAIHGRLGADPVQRTSNSGTVWVTASLAVSIDSSSKDGDTVTEWFSLIAFGRVAESLCRHRKGDMLSAGGKLQLNTWKDKATGKDRRQWQVVADSVISARTVRGGGRRHQQQANHSTDYRG